MLSLAATALFAPLFTFLVLALFRKIRNTGVPAGVISSVGALVSLGAALTLAWRVHAQAAAGSATELVYEFSWLPSAGSTLASLGLRVDGISATMAATVALVATAVQVYSLGYMVDDADDDRGIGRYFAWQSLFLVAMLSLVLAPNLLQAFLGWELVGVCSYLLIGFHYRRPSAARAAVKAFWVTKFADMGFMLGIVYLYIHQGSFSWNPAETGPWVEVVALFIFLGAMGKSAQFPLHVWLPDAMEGPTPVSALLHAATMVAAGVYLVVRAFPLFEAAPATLTFIAWVGAITAFIAACVAVVQDDIKKVLAYSTCSQLGYMMAALGAGAVMAGYFHLTTHAFFKALLFLGSGAAIHAVHSNSIHEMGGLWNRLRGGSILFLVGTLALIGFPGFSGFFSKELVLAAVEAEHLWGPFALLFAGVGLTAFYMGRVLFVAYFGPPSGNARSHEVHGTPATMTVAMAVLAILAAVGGFGGSFLANTLGLEYHFHFTPSGVAATVVALAGLGLAWLLYGRRSVSPLRFGFLAPLGTFIRSGPMDRIYEWGWRRGLLVISAAAGWIDRYVVDGVINLCGWIAIQSGERARRLQTGRAPDYVFAVVLGFILLAAWTAMAGGAQ